LTASTVSRLFGAVALTVLLSVVALVANASAAPDRGASFTCSKLKSSGTGAAEMIKLTGCGGNTGGRSKWIPIAALTGGAEFLWANRTSTSGASPEISAGGVCPNGQSINSILLPITADTTGSVSVGTFAFFQLCSTRTGGTKLAPNTLAVFGYGP
jgi:hypothetical protein